jgi:hypothetical protein
MRSRGSAMKRLAIVAVVAAWVGGRLLAQPPAAPEVLPPTLLKPTGPLSPAEATRQRTEIIKGLKEDLRPIDPGIVTARQVDGRWKVMSGAAVVKDFGSARAAAMETARVLQELRVTRIGTVPGSRPELLYGLVDGKAPRGANARLTVVPVAARSVRAESVGGTWLLTDGTKGLYDFGPDAEAAQRAAVVFWKYGFNQVGVVGGAEAAVLVPLVDPRQAALDKVAPPPNPMPLGVIQDAARTSLLLPGNVYAGPKSPIDPKSLKTVHRDEWVLAHGDEVLARFGSAEHTARGALRALLDARPTEVVRIGECGLPLFLAHGQPVMGAPLGAAKTTLRAESLKVQKLRDQWWVFEETRPVLEVGSKTDAELVVQVVRFFDLKALCVFGQPDKGLRLLTMGR